MSAGRPPTLWCDLIFAATPDLAARLDHVRVERPLDEVADVAELPRLLLEDADELLADDRALLLGLGHPREPGEEPLAGMDVDERDVEVVAERLDDLLGLVLAQQAVVDEHAGELVADRLVDEQCRNRRVDAAREPADHALGADLRADPLDLLLDHRGRRPGRRRAGDVVEEALEHPLTLRRVHDLRVELDAVEPVLGVLERRDRRRLRRGRDARAGRRCGDRVAVAHPDDLLGREIVEERARAVQLDVGLAVLRHVVRLDGAAELAGHELHAVADAERRDAEARRSPGRRAARPPRRPRPARRRGSAPRGCGREAPRRRAGARRARSRPAPRAPGARSAGCTAPRSRGRGPGGPRATAPARGTGRPVYLLSPGDSWARPS